MYICILVVFLSNILNMLTKFQNSKLVSVIVHTVARGEYLAKITTEKNESEKHIKSKSTIMAQPLIGYSF